VLGAWWSWSWRYPGAVQTIVHGHWPPCAVGVGAMGAVPLLSSPAAPRGRPAPQVPHRVKQKAGARPNFPRPQRRRMKPSRNARGGAWEIGEREFGRGEGGAGARRRDDDERSCSFQHLPCYTPPAITRDRWRYNTCALLNNAVWVVLQPVLKPRLQNKDI
jgi:hypothetical protein